MKKVKPRMAATPSHSPSTQSTRVNLPDNRPLFQPLYHQRNMCPFQLHSHLNNQMVIRQLNLLGVQCLSLYNNRFLSSNQSYYFRVCWIQSLVYLSGSTDIRVTTDGLATVQKYSNLCGERSVFGVSISVSDM